MNFILFMVALVAPAFLAGCGATKGDLKHGENNAHAPESFYLPNAEASRVVSVSQSAPAAASIVVHTQAVAVKETGPKDTLNQFGEVYAFSPAFLAVHRDEPTRIRIWNLQPDDEHDFMLVDPESRIMMKVLLPPLKETDFVIIFHEEGLFNFYCAMHQPSMSGQILVLSPKSR